LLGRGGEEGGLAIKLKRTPRRGGYVYDVEPAGVISSKKNVRKERDEDLLGMA